jgi:hypothetical protein
MDRYVTVTQGEVFYMTEVLAALEGLERGPAGNTSLVAAFALAAELPQDAVIVVQETEYTGAGKHMSSQLSFARQNGIDVRFGDPSSDEEIPGENIILPANPGLIAPKEIDTDYLRQSLIRNSLKRLPEGATLTSDDINFLADETRTNASYVLGRIENG